MSDVGVGAGAAVVKAGPTLELWPPVGVDVELPVVCADFSVTVLYCVEVEVTVLEVTVSEVEVTVPEGTVLEADDDCCCAEARRGSARMAMTKLSCMAAGGGDGCPCGAVSPDAQRWHRMGGGTRCLMLVWGW